MIGRLTRDPEMRTGNTGTSFTRFSIAVDRRFKREGEPTADFFNVTCFGKTAEFAANYLTKGRLVVVTGRIEMRKYQDKDGNPRESADITADSVNGLDRPREDDGAPRSSGGGGGRASTPPHEDEVDPFDYD